MKKRVVIAGAVAVLIVLVVVFFRYRSSRNGNELKLSGTVEVTEVDVGFQVPGRVLTLSTDEGRSVLEGEKIAELDSAEYRSLLNQSSALVRNAEAQLEKARADFERYTILYKDGVVSPQQMDAAKTAYDAATSQLEMQLAALKTAKVRLDNTAIHAPLNGVVLRKNVEEGETVFAGTPVLTIGDLENPWVKVYVPENRLGSVSLGQKAAVSVDTFPGRQYDGEVTYISSEAEFTPKNVQTKEERVKLVFGVKVSVQNRNNELKPGMPADVKIFVGNKE
jgi:HlyD family secretion protein